MVVVAVVAVLVRYPVCFCPRVCGGACECGVEGGAPPRGNRFSGPIHPERPSPGRWRGVGCRPCGFGDLLIVNGDVSGVSTRWRDVSVGFGVE